MSPERRAQRERTVARVVVAVVAVVLAWVVIGRVGAPDVPPSAVASPSAGRATAPATPTPSATPAVDAACTTELTVTGEWPGGFGALLVVTSRAGTGDRWQLSWSFPADAYLTELWNATLLHDGSDGEPVRVTAPDWDLGLGPGESVTVGFNGVRGATTPRPEQVTLDGAPCADPADLAESDDPAESDESDESDEDSDARAAPGGTTFSVDLGTRAAAAETVTGGDRDAVLRIGGTPPAR